MCSSHTAEEQPKPTFSFDFFGIIFLTRTELQHFFNLNDRRNFVQVESYWKWQQAAVAYIKSLQGKDKRSY